jgi:hypothetical protein
VLTFAVPVVASSTQLVLTCIVTSMLSTLLLHFFSTATTVYRNVSGFANFSPFVSFRTNDSVLAFLENAVERREIKQDNKA